MNTATYNTYREMNFTTATPAKLIVMMYDGAISSLNRARDSLTAGDNIAKAEALDKALAIINELMGSINPEAGDISVSLKSLYIYFIKRIMQAGLNNDAANIDEVLSLMNELREAWQSVSNGNGVSRTSRGI